ncbi:hypothetical protein LOAG_12377 [Loa loa]|uniref:Uncharacterized protein n=1 Tax=Loa loa TaxID=7209 RepID=A0A1S0TLU0_LOALO|nr:hypothetical protein LOAG_12377 [Loa loa]EFO16131.1 hypothetical protein LOAG_12377 [Loa loa]
MAITKKISTEIIVLTINIAKGKKQKENETMLYRDKILDIVAKLVEKNDNPCAVYVIEGFNDNAIFSKLLTEAEVICELEKIFNDEKIGSKINITNAIESFRKIPWSSQIPNIIFIPDMAMYRNRKLYKNDIRSVKNLLKQMVMENPRSAPRIVIGNPEHFQNISDIVSVYSTNMNVDKLTKAILLALQTKEFTTSEDLFISTNGYAITPSDTLETPSTVSWITTTTYDEIEVENIGSTTTSYDPSMIVTKPVGCESSRILVNFPTAESEAVNSTPAIIAMDNQLSDTISRSESAKRSLISPTLTTTLSYQLSAKTDDSIMDQETTLPFTFILPPYSTLTDETVSLLTLSDKNPQNLFQQSMSHISIAEKTVTDYSTYSTEMSQSQSLQSLVLSTTTDESDVDNGLMTLISHPLTVNLASPTTEYPPIIAEYPDILSIKNKGLKEMSIESTTITNNPKTTFLSSSSSPSLSSSSSSSSTSIQSDDMFSQKFIHINSTSFSLPFIISNSSSMMKEMNEIFVTGTNLSDDDEERLSSLSNAVISAQQKFPFLFITSKPESEKSITKVTIEPEYLSTNVTNISPRLYQLENDTELQLTSQQTNNESSFISSKKIDIKLSDSHSELFNRSINITNEENSTELLSHQSISRESYYAYPRNSHSVSHHFLPKDSEFTPSIAIFSDNNSPMITLMTTKANFSNDIERNK